MNDTLPETGGNAPETLSTRRPDAEAIADGEAAAAALHDLEASHALAEDPERRAADVKIWVENECDYFGIQPKDDPVADQLTTLFCDHECKQHERGRQEYDVTQEEPRRLSRIIERGMTIEAETETTDALDAEADAEDAQTADDEEFTETVEATVESYRAAVDELEGQPNTSKIQALIADERVPEEYKEQLRAFSQIMTIADHVPADAPIVRQRINQLDLSQGVPNPVGFARSFLFDGPESHLKSGVSDATQDAIAAELGIVRNEFSATTGGDINDIYKNGVGTKLVRDPETGELREEPVHLEPGQDVEIREGQYIGLSDTNEPVMKIVGEHTYTSDLPENPTDHDMTMYGMTTQWIAKLNDLNMAEMFFPHSVMERSGGHIELNMPDDFNRAQRLSQAFFGAMSGYNGELLDQSDLDRIPYLMQFQNEKGDAVIGDVNPDQMRADYQRQGIIGKDGHLDWDRFAARVEANRNGLYTSEQNYGQTAHAEAA
jgi:hypothetical protein